MMKKLPDSELMVMQAIWKCEQPVLRVQIDEILQEIHPIAPTTLLTLLTRSETKGFIRIEKTDKAAKYYPLIAEETYLAQESKNFIQKLFNGNMSAFATALCDSGISKEDLLELKKILERSE